MEKKNRNALIWVVIVLVAIVGFWSLSNKWGGVSLTPDGLFASPTPTPTSSPVAGKTTPKPTPVSSITYDQAIQQYASTRIQLDERCQATPGQLVIKKGTKIFFDNRSKEAKTIKFDTQTFTLPGYGWRIITATTTKPLPYDLKVDCKSSTGSTENGLILKIQANILQGL